MTAKNNSVTKVNEILSPLKKKSQPKTPEVEQKVKTSEKNKKIEVPRGRPKSGRIWKSQKQKFSSIKKTKGAHQTFEEKKALRVKLKQIKEASKEIREQKKIEKEERKERRRENIKRAEVNRLKSEIVQVISNSAKIKRMKKKQLRFIEKRDTTQTNKK